MTAPVFDRVTLHLDKHFYPKGDIIIEAPHTGDGGLINKMTLGGKPLTRYRISHDELINGSPLSMQLK